MLLRLRMQLLGLILATGVPQPVALLPEPGRFSILCIAFGVKGVLGRVLSLEKRIPRLSIALVLLLLLLKLVCPVPKLPLLLGQRCVLELRVSGQKLGHLLGRDAVVAIAIQLVHLPAIQHDQALGLWPSTRGIHREKCRCIARRKLCDLSLEVFPSLPTSQQSLVEVQVLTSALRRHEAEWRALVQKRLDAPRHEAHCRHGERPSQDRSRGIRFKLLS
mmetsp:Transcript_148777/g.477843  ORF Transcript_148777/g.477843 Transcript_148777/m.477843 type:complete len:219 (+) Transcript_148777:737-1393(+)